MKSFILSTNFFILTLTVLPLSLCSKNDDNPTEPEEIFEQITIDLSDVPVTVEDTTFSVDGFTFDVFRAVANGESILLAFPQDGNPSMLELDLSDVNGFTKITIAMFDAGGGTTVSLFNDGNLIQENKNIPGISAGDDSFSDVVFELGDQDIDLLRITSLEGFVKSITLE